VCVVRIADGDYAYKFLLNLEKIKINILYCFRFLLYNTTNTRNKYQSNNLTGIEIVFDSINKT